MSSLKIPRWTSGTRKLFSIIAILLITMSVGVQTKDGNLKLLILHNNDMHARFEETSALSGICFQKPCYGGFGRVAHVIREERRKANESTKLPRVLYLNAGDTFTGTVWYTVHREKIVSEFMNMLHPDAMSLGNHEFDDGVKELLPFVAKCKSPIVAANLDFSKERDLQNSNIQKSAVLTLSTGHKVGIIGYLTPDTRFISNPGTVIFEDEVTAILRESEKLNREGVKIIIALGHSGFITDQIIAEKVPLVDIVIGGHTNTFLYNGKPPSIETPEGLYPTEITQPNGKKVPVVQAYAYTKYMGRLSVEFDSNGDLISYKGQPQLLDETVSEERDVIEHLNKYRSVINVLKKEVVGRNTVLLDNRACRVKECNIGNMVADAIVEYHASQYIGNYWTDVSIGLVNSGGLRTSINLKHDNENISMIEVLNAFPFNNPIVLVNLTGQDLYDIFERSVTEYKDKKDGRFMQVSGIQVVYNIDRPNGQRVVSLKTKCSSCSVPSFKKVENSETYNVLVPKFIADGGNGYNTFKNTKLLKIVEKVNVVDSILWYLKRYNPVYTAEEQRITILMNDRFVTKNGNDKQYAQQYLYINIILAFVYIFNKYLYINNHQF